MEKYLTSKFENLFNEKWSQREIPPEITKVFQTVLGSKVQISKKQHVEKSDTKHAGRQFEWYEPNKNQGTTKFIIERFVDPSKGTNRIDWRDRKVASQLFFGWVR